MDHLLDSELESDNESLSQDSERHECFICLGDDDLVKCCSQCYARVHLRCWQEWRRIQRTTIMQMIIHHDERPKNISACTICKTGFACVPGENIEWIWQAETELDVCTEYSKLWCNRPVMFANGIFFIFIMMLALCAIVFMDVDFQDVTIATLIGIYECLLFQIIAVVILRRRRRLARNYAAPEVSIPLLAQ